MKFYGAKSNSSKNKVLAHIIKSSLAYFLLKNIIDMEVRKVKNCKTNNNQFI